MPDHIHLLVGISPTIAVSDFIRIVKANSSKWINEQPEPTNKFRWQIGYGAFTVNVSQFETVRMYIQKQEQHHRKRTFKEELLERHNLEFDLKYVFEEETSA